MKDLKELRDQIDVIDKQMVSLYQERMKIAAEVAEYKIETGKRYSIRSGKRANFVPLRQWERVHLTGMASGSCSNRSCR